MDKKSITVTKIVLEDQEITVPVSRVVKVPVQRTVMVPITTYVTQYVQEIEKVRSPCYPVFQILFSYMLDVVLPTWQDMQAIPFFFSTFVRYC
jgi:hypothetical protein